MDSGHYLLVLRLSQPRELRVGALGEIRFLAGDYVYVGSAQRALAARVARHRRRHDKRFHWHIDSLRDAAQWVERIARGNDILKQHAIEGYTGSTGFMPAKGGSIHLSDAEVESAVEFMVGEAN